MQILIAVPTLNSWRILPNLVNSLKIQTSSKWKLLLIDGNSSKEHLTYLKKISYEDKRISFIKQKKGSIGIFNAMNQAFEIATKDDFILFWGSDESCYSEKTIDLLIKKLNDLMLSNNDKNLIIFNAEFINKSGLKSKRPSFSKIYHECIMDNKHYRFDLFMGYSQAHQATLFSPSSRLIINKYSKEYELAADLDYFLKISKDKSLRVIKVPQKIVKVGEGGISSRRNFKRLFEVMKAYFHSFGIFFIVPFICRYIRRVSKRFIYK